MTTASLPAELFRNVVRYSHPIDGRNVRRMNKNLSYSISPRDLMWGEAGWRHRHRGAANCLLWAARNGRSKVILMLLDTEARASVAGGTKSAFGENSNIALRLAADKGHADVVRLLVSDPRAKVHFRARYRALRLAAFKGHLDVVRVLLDALVDADEGVRAKKGEALVLAAAQGHLEVVRLLLEKGVDVPTDNDAALHRAVEKGHLEVVRLLLEKGVDVHAGDEAALHRAAKGGHLEVVRCLLDAGADVNGHFMGLDALGFAAKNGHLEVARLLLDSGADVHAHGEKALFLAAKNGHLEMVRLLLDSGAIVREQDLAIVREQVLLIAETRAHVEV
ncbi:hypothetical protein HK104_005000, partial [Borealophlyctis nickersoniae]